MPVEDVHKLINAIDDKKTYFNSPPFISEKLRELVGIPKPIEFQQQFEKVENNLKQQIENKLEQAKEQTENKLNELKQQMQDMNGLLSSLIKNLNVNNDIKEKIDVNDNNDMDIHSNKKA